MRHRTLLLPLAIGLLALPAALAGFPARAMPGDVFVDYGQAAYRPAPSTKVSWFTTLPVVIAPATVVEAPPLTYAYAGAIVPPPMVKSVTVYEGLPD